MGIDEPKTSPFVAITLDVSAAKNRSNQFLSSSPLVSCATVPKYLLPFFRRNNKGVVTAGLNAVVDLDIPVLERRAHGFNLAFNALLDWREYHPAIL